MLLMLKIFVLLHPQTSGRFELTNYKSIKKVILCQQKSDYRDMVRRVSLSITL